MGQYIAPHGVEYKPSIVTKLNNDCARRNKLAYQSKCLDYLLLISSLERRGTKGSLLVSFRAQVLSF